MGATTLMRWHPDQEAYVVHQPGAPDPDGFFAFGPGRGVWLAPTAPLTLEVLGEPVAEGAFTLELPNGWSNLANPYDRDLTWDLANIIVLVDGVERGSLADPANADLVRPYLWLWDMDQQRHYPILPPLTGATIPRTAGFWTRALVDGVQLRLPGAGSRSRAAAAGPRDWQLQLQAACGDESAVALLGAQNARSRNLLVEAPPQSQGQLKLETLSADGRGAGELQAGTQRSWRFDLAVGGRAGEVTLSWPSLLRTLPRGLLARLEDPTSGRTVLLNTHGAYRYQSDGSERRLTLTCEYGQLQRPQILSLSAQPTRGRGLSVSLNLSGPGEVRLRVRGLGGRLVRELAATADSSPYEVSWDGCDNTGRRLPAGVYQLEAEAVGPDGSTSRAVRTVSLP